MIDSLEAAIKHGLKIDINQLKQAIVLDNKSKENICFNDCNNENKENNECHDIKTSEALIFSALSAYLKTRARSKASSLLLCNSIYNQFIDNDNEAILKSIRRLLVIYHNCRKRLKIKFLWLWRIKVRKASSQSHMTTKRRLISELTESKIEVSMGLRGSKLCEEKSTDIKLDTKVNKVNKSHLSQTNKGNLHERVR